MTLLVLWSFCHGGSAQPPPGDALALPGPAENETETRASAEPRPIPDIDTWRSKTDDLIEEMLGTVRRRDFVAFSRELAEHIVSGARPRNRYLEELSSLLRKAPPGLVLNTLIRTLLENASERAIEIVFDALSREDFTSLKGSRLGEGQTDARHRVIELYVSQLGDRIHRSRYESSPIELPASLARGLVYELASEIPRRVRCAAYLLGGMASKSAAPFLLAAAKRFRDPSTEMARADLMDMAMTRAVLIEALGRTDPSIAGDEIVSALEADSEAVRLAAIPLLGLLKGKRYESLIQESFNSKEWTVRRAAVEACENRRDVFGMGLLIKRYPKETRRLQYDILQVLHDFTDGVLPPDPKEWPKWWKLAQRDFEAAPRKKEKGGSEKTVLIIEKTPDYFGIEIWSSQLAILLDVSGSMASTNLRLGLSGVALTGAAKTGSPLAIAKQQLERLFKALPSKTLFNLITYNQKIKLMSPKLVRASRGNVRKSIGYVKKLKASGGTNIYESLVAGLKEKRVDTIYMLSDGEPTDGLRTEPDEILEDIQRFNRFRRTRINTIQLGQHSELMKSLAESSGGVYKHFAFASGETKIEP